MTRLRKMLLEELQRRNYSAITTRNYLRVVSDFAKHFGKSPDKLGPNELSKSRVGGWQVRWCVSCGAAAQTTGFGFRTARFPLFGSSDISIWQRGFEIPVARLRGDHGCPHPPSLFPSRSGNGGSGVSHSPLGALSGAEKSSGNKIFNSRICVY